MPFAVFKALIAIAYILSCLIISDYMLMLETMVELYLRKPYGDLLIPWWLRQ